MKNNFEEYFKQLFKGLEITEEEEKQIKFIYLVQIYKSIVELLITLKGGDKVFVDEFTKYLDVNVKSLDAETLSQFDKAMENERGRIIESMTQTILATASEDQKKAIEENLARMTQVSGKEENSPLPLLLNRSKNQGGGYNFRDCFIALLYLASLTGRALVMTAKDRGRDCRGGRVSICEDGPDSIPCRNL